MARLTAVVLCATLGGFVPGTPRCGATEPEPDLRGHFDRLAP